MADPMTTSGHRRFHAHPFERHRTSRIGRDGRRCSGRVPHPGSPAKHPIDTSGVERSGSFDTKPITNARANQANQTKQYQRRGGEPMNDPTEKFATPRLAAGALFICDNKVLLVRKTYGNRWDIPGGYVDRGESPASACERELQEELGLKRSIRRLLAHDWAPDHSEGDKMFYVFDCGKLGKDEQNIRLDQIEIDGTQWVLIEELQEYVIPRLERRLTQAFRAYTTDTVLYLEHGRRRT
jgi:8-oxo-dGTP diphosphatase